MNINSNTKKERINNFKWKIQILTEIFEKDYQKYEKK